MIHKAIIANTPTTAAWCFYGIYLIDSSKIGLVKPSLEIFNYAAEKAKTAPERILFVENGAKHVEGAKKAGWHTFLYDPSDAGTSNKNLLDKLAI